MNCLRPVGAVAQAVRLAARFWVREAIDGPQVRFLFENPDKFDAREWLKPAREAAKAVCKQRYLEFGCEGQGAKIKGYSLQEVAQQYAAGALAQVVN